MVRYLMFALALTALVPFADTPEATIAAFVKAFNDNDAPALARQVVGGQVTDTPLNPTHVTLKATVVKTTLSDDDAYLEVETEYRGASIPDFTEGKGTETVHLRRSEGDWRVVPFSSMGLPNFGTIALFASDAPVVQQSRRAAKQTACLSNVKQLCIATFIYAGDNDDVFPKDASRWKAAIMPYIKNEAVFHCPEDVPGRVSYFLDPRLAGKSMTDLKSPAETAMIVEGTPKTMAFRHQGRSSMGYADGHAAIIAPDQADRARKIAL